MMRLQLILLALITTCSVLSGDASVATTTKASSIAVNQIGAPVKRLLRSDAIAQVDNDNEEERAAWVDGLTKLLKPSTTKILTKLERQDPELKKFTQKYDLTGAFKALKLTRFNTVDELFTSKNYELWFSYMLLWNKQNTNEPFTVAKMFSKQFGTKKAFKMFTDAARSNNPYVQQMGQGYQVQLFYQFYKADDDYKKFVDILGSEKEAGKMFAALTKSPSAYDRHLGENFATTLMNKWADKGMTHAQVVKIDQSFDQPYFYVLTFKVRQKQSEATANAIAAKAAAEREAIRAAGAYARRV